LAGGVAIGATCDHATHMTALLIGLVAGAISTTGFAVLQEKQKKWLNAVDTCGFLTFMAFRDCLEGLWLYLSFPV